MSQSYAKPNFKNNSHLVEDSELFEGYDSFYETFTDTALFNSYEYFFVPLYYFLLQNYTKIPDSSILLINNYLYLRLHVFCFAK